MKNLKKRHLAVVDETEVYDISHEIFTLLMDSNLAFYQMLGVLELVKLDLADCTERVDEDDTDDKD